MNYKIKDVSDQIGISSYTLRYYEKEGIIPPIKRDDNGNRIYDGCDMGWIELVCCLRDTGMELADIKRIVKLSNAENEEESLKERLKILTNHKESVLSTIEQLQNKLSKIDKKIDFYNKKSNQC